jgi:hypothetical protein
LLVLFHISSNLHYRENRRCRVRPPLPCSGKHGTVAKIDGVVYPAGKTHNKVVITAMITRHKFGHITQCKINTHGKEKSTAKRIKTHGKIPFRQRHGTCGLVIRLCQFHYDGGTFPSVYHRTLGKDLGPRRPIPSWGVVSRPFLPALWRDSRSSICRV